MSKTVMITGGSRGIGAACCEYFAAKGYQVGFTYKENRIAAENIQRKIENYGVGTCAVCADFSLLANCKKAVETIQHKLGNIDVLINNAAIGLCGLFTDISDAEEETIINTNLRSVLSVTKQVLPSMICAHKGSIVNISSMWGQVGASCEVHYSVTKAAIIGFTKALAKEVAPSGIRVNCIAPGVIQTDMNRHLSCEDMTALCDETPLMRIGTPEEVARCVYFLAENDASFVTGQTLGVNGGFII